MKSCVDLTRLLGSSSAESGHQPNADDLLVVAIGLQYLRPACRCCVTGLPVVGFCPFWLELDSLLGIIQGSIPVAAAQVGCSSVAEQRGIVFIACNSLAVQLDGT